MFTVKFRQMAVSVLNEQIRSITKICGLKNNICRSGKSYNMIDMAEIKLNDKQNNNTTEYKTKRINSSTLHRSFKYF